MDRGAWWATVHGISKSRTQLSDKAYIHITIKVLGVHVRGGPYEYIKCEKTGVHVRGGPYEYIKCEKTFKTTSSEKQ